MEDAGALELLGAEAGAEEGTGRLDGCESGGGATEGASSSSNKGADASCVDFARSSAAGSLDAICLRSTMPESCSGERPLAGGGAGVFDETGIRDEGTPPTSRDESGASVGDDANLARS